MSLRKSACPTPRRLDAQRRNARHSTGPRTPAGRERMKMNALQHGCDAAPENDAAVMQALGEDPQQFQALQQELATAYGPGDALWDHQIDDLARLYWRRRRLERLLTGRMREALERVRSERRELARALADVSFQPSQFNEGVLGMLVPTHPLVRRRQLISFWGVILEQVGRRYFDGAQLGRVEAYYRGELGWRPRQIARLLGLFCEWTRLREQECPDRVEKYVKKRFGDEAGMEARRQELLRLMEEQRAEEEAAFEEDRAAEERKDAIAQDACLAPEDRTGEMLLRQQAGLDRSIDRKVRILLALRKEQAQRQREEARPPDDEVARTAAVAVRGSSLAQVKPADRKAGGPRYLASLRETQTPNGRGLRQPANGERRRR